LWPREFDSPAIISYSGLQTSRRFYLPQFRKISDDDADDRAAAMTMAEQVPFTCGSSLILPFEFDTGCVFWADFG
jgi:hypothetical protein